MNCRLNICLILFATALIASSCASPPTPNSPAVSLLTPQNPPGIAVQSPGPTATYIPNTRFIKLAIWAPVYLGETFLAGLPESVRAYFVSDPASANVRLEIGEQNAVGRWVFVLVAPFSTTLQGVSKDDLFLSWQGQPTGPFAGQPILMDQNTYALFSAVWGPAAPSAVSVIATNEMIDYAWANQPAWAIVPFESLEPRWKVLAVDGVSPIQRDSIPRPMPLRSPFP